MTTVATLEVPEAVPDSADRDRFTQASRDLADPEEAVRIRAVGLLRCTQDELSARALATQLACEPSARVREECLTALASFPKDASGTFSILSVLRRGLTDESPGVRLAAVRSIYRFGGRPAANALVPALSDESGDVRRRAAVCIGWLGATDLVVHLLPLLADEEAFVRQAVIQTMSNLRSEEVLPVFIEQLCERICSDQDPEVRRTALEIFGFAADGRSADSTLASKEARRFLAGLQPIVAGFRHKARRNGADVRLALV